MKQIRMTGPTIAVLAILLETGRQASGSEIGRASNLMSGTLYPVLHRLEQAGWIEGADEDVDPHVVGRPRKRFYSLRQEARRAAMQATAKIGYWSNQEVDRAV